MGAEMKGLLFDIQGYSVHDGPGCRTVCFLNGCPLSCQWCANPESWPMKKNLMFMESKCKSPKACFRCGEACPKEAVRVDEQERLLFDREKCAACSTFECVEVCYLEALKVCGRYYTAEELMKIFQRDRQFWGIQGGVTFSGGEPLVQKDFLISLLKLCKDAYIHTAIETTAYGSMETFLEVMQYIDFAFIDMKHMDRDKHKEKTGVYNDCILENIRALTKAPWQGRLVLRMPLIEGYNDDKGHMKEIIRFMKETGLIEINILPFHRMGDSKWRQMGKSYSYSDQEPTSIEKLDTIQDIFLDAGIACYIGHETAF
jgi:pyruvate formate lyase activating enzyme